MFANALGYGGPRDPDGFEGYSYKDLRRISTGRTRRETGGMAANIRVPKKKTILLKIILEQQPLLLILFIKIFLL